MSQEPTESVKLGNVEIQLWTYEELVETDEEDEEKLLGDVVVLRDGEVWNERTRWGLDRKDALRQFDMTVGAMKLIHRGPPSVSTGTQRRGRR